MVGTGVGVEASEDVEPVGGEPVGGEPVGEEPVGEEPVSRLGICGCS